MPSSVGRVTSPGAFFRDSVTGDSDLKTSTLYLAQCVCVPYSTLLIYYSISLSLVSLMSPANKHRGLIGDRDRDTEIFCHDSGRIYAQPAVFCFRSACYFHSEHLIPASGLPSPKSGSLCSASVGPLEPFGRLKSRTGPVPTEPPSLFSDCLPVGPSSDRIRSDCRVAEQAPLRSPVKRLAVPLRRLAVS
jgi:hypothetical protein